MNIQLSDHFTYKKLIRFTLPSVAMMIFTSIYGVVDGFFVSNFAGKTPFAAVNLIMPFLMILGTVGFIFGTGGTAIVAKTFGEGKPEKANRYFSLFTYTAFILGVVFAIVGIVFIRPVSVMLGAEGELLENCVLYARIILLALPFYVLQLLFQSFFVSAEKPQLGLIVTVSSGIANMVLDALLVTLLPPAYRLAGAAVATGISQVIGGAVPLVYFSRENTSILRLGKTEFDGRALDIFDRALAERREIVDNTDLTPFVDEVGNVQFSEKGSGEKRYLLAGEFPDGRKVYKTNYPIGTPKTVKQQDIINVVQNVWSKKPITLNIGNEQIEAQFDPELTERSDLSKIAFGNRKGNASDKRITLNLSSDLYMIASDAMYTGLKKEVGKKDNPAHDNVIQWRYFATNLIYEEEDGTLIPCYMNIDVKQKEDGNYFYSFGIEKGTAPQTLLAVVNDNKSPTVPDNNIPHQKAIVNNNDMQKSQNNAQGSNGKQHFLGAVIEEGATTEENSVLEYNSTAKSRTKLERYENEAVRKVADAMSVRLGTAREFLKPIIQEMSNEYMKTGKLSQDTIDRLFEEAYKNGRKVNDEAYKEYADLRNYLRNTKIYFDSESAADIPDFFKDIRRYMGRLSVSSTKGTSVDSIYQELNEMHPSLFPEDILSSSDRMLRIMEVSDSLRKEEVTLDAYYNTEETKGDLKHEFEKAVYAFKDNLYEVKQFNDSLEKAEVKPGVEIDADAMQSVYDELTKVQKQSDKVMNNLLLTKDENAILDDMLKGNRKALREDIPDRMNKDNILKAYEVKAPVRAMQNIIENHKKAVRNNRNDTAMKMIELSDFWKDKKVLGGLRYATETQERNIYDIVHNKKDADKIIETYFTPVHEHEAQRTRFKHDYFDRVRKMDIDLRVRSGNKNTESEAIQFIGEVEGDIADLEAKAEKRKLTDDENDRLINLKGSLVEFKENNPNLDYGKVANCIKEFHKIYDELFEEMNIVRIRNGYAPVEYRKNYFPHFLETGTDEITGKIAKALGINIDVTELPTDLVGRTENFKPGIAWVQHVKRRNTNVTKYDAVEGFQKYIEGVSDVIFHTDDIQNLRALERSLRYKYSEKGVKDEIDALRDRTDITDDERETLLDEAGKRNITSLGNYVNNLTEYTNLLANKKSMHDRSPETMFGRKIYNLFNWANSRVASNMIVGNLSTAITNFIPLTQATAVVGDVNMMIGFNQTVKNFLYDDGLTERSSFLTNRFGKDKLISKSKVADVLVTPMEFVDELTAGTIWRARYNQNIKKGMSDTDAIKDAPCFYCHKRI